MKCHNCAKNEATNRLLINYPGHAAEVYLCAECLGNVRQYFSSLFNEVRVGSLFSAQAHGWPNFGLHTVQGVGEGQLSGGSFPLDAGEDIKLQRRLGELKEKLRAAVQTEDYEAAATLRDEIYKMEERGVRK